MKLCITEKPSVAADIARLIGANARRQGFFEGNDYCVTWTFGHLCCLKEPHDYSDRWKRWSLGALPMLPDRFGIKLIPDRGIEAQFKVIETLAAQADEIINCGDAGQEGELIQRWVMQKAGVKCPVKRLWISSMTDQAIRDGFANLDDQTKYDNLYLAGLSRAIGDWILGMNATRLYSLKYSEPGRVLSIGRVQTPTLAMIVKRHFEIENFVPQDTFEVHTLYREVDFTSQAKFDTPEKAEALAAELAPLPFTVDNVTSKQVREAPPRLFDLTSLQVECNRRWGWTADDTLKLIQALYEKKVTTYPRVDTTYLPDDVYPKVPDILHRMVHYADKTAPVLAGKLPKSKKVFDNSKVTDHHAIIPTGESPERLAGDEKLLYHLIAIRFIAAFYPDCLAQQTVVEAHVADTQFKATGKVITSPGWRVLYPKKGDSSDSPDDDSNPQLPPMTAGETGPHTPQVVKKTSQPPKLYTEGTLLRAMETAGRTIDDDDELREAMKENGIGRPSTRAAIIETLFKRGYIARRRKAIVATDAGIALINTINEELIKSPRLTGLWENKLRRISHGNYSAAEFVAELKEMIHKIVHDVLSDNTSRKIIPESDSATAKQPQATAKAKRTRAKPVKSLEDIACPLCGKGHLIRGRTAYGCSEYAAGCTYRLPFDKAAPDATPAQVAKQVRQCQKSSKQSS